MIRHSSRRQASSTMQRTGLLCLFTTVLWLITGCGSRPLSGADPNAVMADIALQQQQNVIEVAVTLRTPGQRAWLKPEPQDLWMRDASGHIIQPDPVSRAGVSLFQLEPSRGPFVFYVLDVIAQPIPILDTPVVHIEAPTQSPWQVTDRVQLQVRQTQPMTAQWVLRCGAEQWRFKAQLEPEQTDLSLDLGQLWQQFEQHTGARITGTAHLDLEVFWTPDITPAQGVRFSQWRQLWRHQAQLQSPRSSAQVSGALRLGTANFSLGIQTTPILACR